MRRRSFLAGILAAGVAPAAVGSGILMPVRKIIASPTIDSFGLDLGAGDMGTCCWMQIKHADGTSSWLPWFQGTEFQSRSDSVKTVLIDPQYQGKPWTSGSRKLRRA